MQFRIKTILTLTIVVALLMAFRHWTLMTLALLMLFVHFALFLGPVAIVFASIVFGDQKGSRIDVSNNKIVGFLLRVWLLSFAIVALFWLLLAAYFHFSGISW